MGVLAAQNWFSYQRKGGQDDHLKKLTRNVSNARVEMRAFLAQTTITMSELLALQVGDVITTDKSVERDVLIQIEGKNKFLGKVGQFRGARAVSVTRVCQHPVDAAAGSPAGASASASNTPAPALAGAK
jgi:flagellar motor switch protein FliM